MAHSIFATCVDPIFLLGFFLREINHPQKISGDSMLILRVPWHAHIHTDDPPPLTATAAALCTGHVHFVPQPPPHSTVIAMFQADFGISSPTAALTLADLLGMDDVLTYLLFQSCCLQGLFGTRTEIIPRLYAIPSAGSVR